MATATITGTESGITVVQATISVLATITGPSSGVRGQTLTFILGANESGLPASSVFKFSIQWGDGSPVQTVFGPTGTQVSHVFTTTGSFGNSVTASDASGNSGNSGSLATAITAIALQADPSNASQTALVVGGTIGDDTIVFTPADRQGGITVMINGVNQGSFHPTGHIIAYGQAGNDTFRETTQRIRGRTVFISAPALFFAGGGNDTLDASGSTAGNVLVGGAGNDSLIGGQGRDILIGGLGVDTLQAGSGGDILIGGTTSYDGNSAALAAILAEWARTDIDYTTRIAHLTGSATGGLNGSYFLNSSSVSADGSANSLSGGPGQDWYFAGMLDLILNHSTGEVVTSI
jgi:Ca2+-binding RTX toxin-like protein